MKKILLFVMTLFMLSSCGGDAVDRTVAIYEDATEKVLSAKNRDELRSLERQFNVDYSNLKRETMEEIAELELKAKGGDKKAIKRLENIKEAMFAYINAKNLKRKELKQTK